MAVPARAAARPDKAAPEVRAVRAKAVRVARTRVARVARSKAVAEAQGKAAVAAHPARAAVRPRAAQVASPVAGGSVGGFLPPNLLALLRLIQIDGHGIRLPNGLSLDDL